MTDIEESINSFKIQVVVAFIFPQLLQFKNLKLS